MENNINQVIHKIKYGIKNTLAFVLFYTGILSIIKTFILRNKCVVLMYHRVLTDKEIAGSFSHPGIIVRKSTFEKQLIFLQTHFNIISQNAFLSRLKKKTTYPIFHA